MSKNIKIGISDGCANGGMMDSLYIAPIKPKSGWKPRYRCEVSENEWEQWREHLEAHAKWDNFWSGKLTKQNQRGGE